jgi:hypothetical protein
MRTRRTFMPPITGEDVAKEEVFGSSSHRRRNLGATAAMVGSITVIPLQQQRLPSVASRSKPWQQRPNAASSIAVAPF